MLQEHHGSAPPARNRPKTTDFAPAEMAAGGKGEENHRGKTSGNGGKGGGKKVRFNATTWACRRCQGTAQSWGAYNWWHRKECYECGAPRPAKDPGDEVPREKPGAIAPWEKNTKELENLKHRGKSQDPGAVGQPEEPAAGRGRASGLIRHR